MAASKGRLFVIKRGDGATSEAFTTIAGIRTTSLTINNEPVEITSKDSAGYRTYAADFGVVSMSISGSGVFDDDTALRAAQTACLDQQLENYEILDGTTADKFSGSFMVTSIEYGGEYNGEVTWSLSLESSGTVIFTEA